VKDHAILHSYLALVQLLEQAFTSEVSMMFLKAAYERERVCVCVSLWAAGICPEGETIEL